jgi:hypothetical protein
MEPNSTKSGLAAAVSQVSLLDPEALAAQLTTELALPDHARGALVADLRHRLDELLDLADALGAPEDVEELYRALAFSWLGLRSDWTRLNLLIQYRTMSAGEPRPSDVASGAVVSALLAAVEPLLAPHDQDLLVRVAAEPLAITLSDPDWLDRFAENRRQAVARIEVEALAQEGVVGPVAGSLDAADPLRRAVHAVAHIPLELVWGPLASRVVERLAPRRVVLVNDSPSDVRVDVRDSARLERELADAVRGAIDGGGELARPVVHCAIDGSGVHAQLAPS